ncbi:hypothetical protein RF644_17640 [Kocuria sp. CPCC 205258]|uniref:hypothetical protein n=1 Tax=Kocuria sp. CPCC 205258 TaxID=3073552 RepID=UPI0034D438FE
MHGPARRAVYATVAAASLTAGAIQILQSTQLGWAAILAAAVTFAGLALVTRGARWGQLLVGWGLLTSLAWFIAVLFSLLGRSGDFPFAGWMVGIGIYLVTYREARRQNRDGHRAGIRGEG